MDRADVEKLLEEMAALHRRVVERADPVPAATHAAHVASAANLRHFLALRADDLRDVQDRLSHLGLSSLGRCEAHVVDTLDRVLTALRALLEADPVELPRPGEPPRPDYEAGIALLAANATGLLGEAPIGRDTRILLTLPTEAASEPDLVLGWVEDGIDLARINGAHDDPDAWRAMAANVRAAAAAHDREVRILADLAGPKLRTGPVASLPGVVRIRPQRDRYGNVVRPGRAALGPEPDPRAPLHVPAPWEFVAGLEPGDVVELADARGAHRRLLVVEADARAAVIEVHRTTYLVNGSVLHHGAVRTTITDLPDDPGRLSIREGDRIALTSDLAPARPVDPGSIQPVGCTLPEAVAALAVGERVFLDDGKFAGAVESIQDGRAVVRIEQAPPGGGWLRAEKGINLPDTEVPVPALTAQDHEALATFVEIADIVALSFVRTPDDVAELQQRLRELGADHIGLALKIETVQGFRNLPEIVMTAMVSRHVGVMIARGDLAVEAGYERLAEVQEEILWLCESAHLPVIWATEVLDRLARTGRPSRAEITDAAMAERAECVMLNKGPFISSAIETLDDILCRMTEHQRKKRPLLRRLRSWAPDQRV